MEVVGEFCQLLLAPKHNMWHRVPWIKVERLEHRDVGWNESQQLAEKAKLIQICQARSKMFKGHECSKLPNNFRFHDFPSLSITSLRLVRSLVWFSFWLSCSILLFRWEASSFIKLAWLVRVSSASFGRFSESALWPLYGCYGHYGLLTCCVTSLSMTAKYVARRSVAKSKNRFPYHKFCLL